MKFTSEDGTSFEASDDLIHRDTCCCDDCCDFWEQRCRRKPFDHTERDTMYDDAEPWER